MHLPTCLALYLVTPGFPRLFRAKRIQNRAVVNESPTERLVKELKAENARLLQRLSRLGQDGRRASEETSKSRGQSRGTQPLRVGGVTVCVRVQRNFASC